MAESESGAERNLPPTEKRLREAREKGQIARSRELNSAAVTITAAATLMICGHSAGEKLLGIFRDTLVVDRRLLEDPESMPLALGHSAVVAVGAITPILAAAAVAGLLAPLLLGGWVFSTTAWLPDVSRLDPLAGLKRMFGSRGLVELGKALLKLVVVGAIAAGVTHKMMAEMLNLGSLPTEISIGHAGALIVQALLFMSLGLLLIAAVDAPYQWWTHHQQLLMTREEVRQEMKENEGRPEVKNRVRQLRQKYAKQRMMQRVPSASVVVTNPTHFAVALKYDPGRDKAPRVVAKGRDLVAAEIRRIAVENGVPLFEAPPLARAIYGTTDIDREIPQGLYVAVAQVLSYVFQVRTMTAHRAARLRRPAPVVGEEFAKYVSDPDGAGETEQ